MTPPSPRGTAPGTGLAPWQLDPGLVRLAFGSVPGPAATSATQVTSHLAFLPPESLELDLSEPGQRELGDYELLEVIGEGGMGVVYRARQHSLDREVALKLLSAGPWASEEFIAGFRREAQNAALLQHPNIVAVHAMGEQDGLVFYAMELVRGQSLAQRLCDGPMPARDAALLMRTVAEAVDYAHRLGVLHLDLKPGNILLERDGTAKVTDFGLARRLGQALSLDNEQISGTPSYMAPEQARVRSSKLTPATDVWGLGAVLYELLGGLPPFVADSPQETLRQVLEGSVRGFGRRAAVPRDLEAICLHCLEKEPASRYATARDLADDLGRFIEGRSVAVRPLGGLQRIARWARREPRFATAAGIAVLAVLAGLTATTQQWRRADRNANVARTQLWSQRSQQAWRAIIDRQGLDALAPLVQNLVEQELAGDRTAAETSRSRIASVLAQAPSLIQVIGVGKPAFVVALAKDGRWVAVATEDGLVHLFDLPSGRERWRTDTRRATHFMMQAAHVGYLWQATDGRYLLAARPYPDPLPYPSGFNQLRLDLSNGALWRPSQPDFRDATFSPDGGFALVRTHQLRTRLTRVGDGKPLSPWRAFDASNPAWLLAPHGRHAAMATEGLGRVELWDGATLRTRFTYRFGDAQIIRSWLFTPAGSELVLGHQDGQISVVDAATGALTELRPQRPASVEQMRISEDGRWLSASYDDGYALVWDLPRRELLTRPMHLGEAFSNLEIDARTRTAFSRDEHKAEVWRIPEALGPASVLHRRPGVPTTRYARANGWSPAVGLLATGTVGGEVRIWRTRQALPLPWAPSPQPADTVFDGRHVVAVDGARVQVMDAVRRRAAGAPVVHPQAVGFAFLAGNGETLVASAGHRVQVSDWRLGKVRFAPIALGNSPNRLLATPDGEVLVSSQLTRQAGTGRTQITAHSLKDGRQLASIHLESPIHGMRLSSDGQSLLAWRGGELHVLDVKSLAPMRPMQRFGPDAIATRRALYASDGPVEVTDPDAFWGVGVMDADVDAERRQVWVLTSEPRLLAIPLAGGPTLHDIPVPAQPTRVEAISGGAAILSADKGLLRFSPSQGLHSTASIGPVAMTVMARSRDGRRLAVSTGQGAVLYDIASGDWLTTPIQLLDDPHDPLHSLALDGQGRALLVQTLRRRFVVTIPRESRPAAELARLVPLWRPDDELDAARPTEASAGASGPRLPDARLPDPRVQDPGPAAMAPAPPPAFVLSPLRPSEPRFVDLRPHCNVLGGDAGEMWPPTLLLRTLPRGRQRLLGEDFWIDCGVGMALAAGGDADMAGWAPRTDAIAVRTPRFAALDVLLTGMGTTAGFGAVPYATIELRYRDNTSARLSIRGRTQVWPWWHDGTDLPEQPLAYLSQFAVTTTSNSWLSLSRFYAVRLENPHPEKDVESLALAATPYAWSSPVVLAITLAETSPSAPTRVSAAMNMPQGEAR